MEALPFAHVESDDSDCPSDLVWYTKAKKELKEEKKCINTMRKHVEKKRKKLLHVSSEKRKAETNKEEEREQKDLVSVYVEFVNI